MFILAVSMKTGRGKGPLPQNSPRQTGAFEVAATRGNFIDDKMIIIPSNAVRILIGVSLEEFCIYHG